MKINQKKEKELKIRQILSTQKSIFGAAAKRASHYIDKTLEESQKRRERRRLGAFSFAEPGMYQKRAEELRQAQAADPEKTTLQSVESTKGISEASSSGITRILNRTQKVKAPDTIPDIEWWDAFLLPPDTKEFPTNLTEENINVKRITNLIQHPAPVKNEYLEKINNSSIKVMLTEKERKKQSRIKRLEKERDKREKNQTRNNRASSPQDRFGQFHANFNSRCGYRSFPHGGRGKENDGRESLETFAQKS
eukprot:TRINITY_DN26317_c0_g1_i1.p2 TRINITY_DN26317_c0_g1~~TRINITY_DN26317_c0_g1_i1.p2  ORF type:complete len:251 (-),score=42.42 TRINITY_DN26317_c0_g1_i1:165-917(-)